MRGKITEVLRNIRRKEWHCDGGTTQKIFSDEGGQNHLSYVRRPEAVEIMGQVAGLNIDYRKIGGSEEMNGASKDPEITDFLLVKIQEFHALAINA